MSDTWHNDPNTGGAADGSAASAVPPAQQDAAQPAPPPPPAAPVVQPAASAPTAPAASGAAGGGTTPPQTTYVYQQTPERKPRRRGWVPVVGALAAGTIFGAAAGAGSALLVVQASGTDSAASVQAATQTLVVNDTDEITAVTAVAAAAIDSAVTIDVTGGGSSGSGSGVILDTEGHIVTNTHVVTLGGVTADPELTVTLHDGRVYQATVIGMDPLLDLAVIQIEGAEDLVPIEFGDSSDLNVGDLTVAIGAPLGYSGTVTSGIVSALDRSIQVASSAAPDEDSDSSGDQFGELDPDDYFNFDIPGLQQSSTPTSYIQLPVIQTDSAINPGNSGGALLDEDAKLIGINVAIATAGDSSGSVGVGFAIPSNTVKRIAEELIATGTATHGLLGVTVANASSDPELGVVGALVDEVVDGSGAAEGGLRSGDVITVFDDVLITSSGDLTAQVRTHAVGSTVTVTYLRDGSYYDTEVTLGELTDD